MITDLKKQRIYRKTHIFMAICLCICLLASCSKSNKPNEDHIADKPIELFFNADINEQVVYNSQNIIIKTVSLSMNTPEGPILKFSGENNTGYDRIITIRNCSVNNIMINPKFEMRLEHYEAASADAVFSAHFLLTADIQTFTGISFNLRISDASDNKKYIDTDQCNVFTSMSGKYTQKHDFRGTLIADANGVKIKVGRIEDAKASMGKQIYIYIDNSTSADIIVETTDTQVNGIEIDPLFFTTVGAGKKSWAPLTFKDSDIIKNSIESIDHLAISLCVFSIYGTILDTGACQVVFEEKNNVYESYWM